MVTIDLEASSKQKIVLIRWRETIHTWEELEKHASIRCARTKYSIWVGSTFSRKLQIHRAKGKRNQIFNHKNVNFLMKDLQILNLLVNIQITRAALYCTPQCEMSWERILVGSFLYASIKKNALLSAVNLLLGSPVSDSSKPFSLLRPENLIAAGWNNQEKINSKK